MVFSFVDLISPLTSDVCWFRLSGELPRSRDRRDKVTVTGQGRLARRQIGGERWCGSRRNAGHRSRSVEMHRAVAVHGRQVQASVQRRSVRGICRRSSASIRNAGRSTLRTSAGGWPPHLLWKSPKRAFTRKCLQLFKEDAREAGGRRADEFDKRVDSPPWLPIEHDPAINDRVIRAST